MTDYEQDFYTAVAANLGLEINSIPDDPVDDINKLWQIFVCGTHSAAKQMPHWEDKYRDLQECVVKAIERGEWNVDGANDPDRHVCDLQRCMPTIKKAAEEQACLA